MTGRAPEIGLVAADGGGHRRRRIRLPAPEGRPARARRRRGAALVLRGDDAGAGGADTERGAVRTDCWPEAAPGCPPLAWIAPALVPEIAERPSAEAPGPSDETALSWEGGRRRWRCLLNAPATVGAVLSAESLAPVPQPPAGEATGTLAVAGAAARAGPRLARGARVLLGAGGLRLLRLSLRISSGRFGFPRTSRRGPRGAVTAPAESARACLRGDDRGTSASERLDFAAPAAVPEREVQLLAASHGAALTKPEAAESRRAGGGVRHRRAVLATRCRCGRTARGWLRLHGLAAGR